MSFAIVVLACFIAVGSAHPVKKETLDISFAPETTMVINEGQVQMFRAPLCKGEWVDKWVFNLEVFMMNVQWDSREIGDDNWLKIRISNKAGMTSIICENEGQQNPKPSCGPFTYDKAKWGNDDLYVEITASSGSPTYQYGLNILARDGDKMRGYPEAMSVSKPSTGNKLARNLPVETLEQVAIPYPSDLVTLATGQYHIPYCFEDKYAFRMVSTTVLVRDDTHTGPGGVASYLCTHSMMRGGECYRSLPKKRGTDFYDASGAKVNTISTKISKAEYGPVHVLVLAQGDWHKSIDFSITTKLRAPTTETLTHEDHDEDVKSVISLLKAKIDSRRRIVDDEPEEKKEEL